MDTLLIDNALQLQREKYNSLAYEDIEVGGRMLLTSISKETIRNNHIHTIIDEGFNIEKYDSAGYLTYEKCDSWSYGADYSYCFDKNGKPLYVVKYGTDTIRYKYDNNNRLVQCGGYTIKYYPNGFKKSVETRYEIERYEYDKFGNICHINFDLKPETSACGNRTSEWYGKHDKNHRLVKILEIGSSCFTRSYRYSDKGDLLKCTRKDYSSIEKPTTTNYIYTANTLTIK